VIEDRGSDYGFIIEYANKQGFDCVWRPLETCSGKQEIIETLSDCDAVIAGGQNYDRGVFEALSPKLKIIARFGIGYEHVDLDCAAEYGIAVSNTPGAMSAGVAELAITMMLAIGRQIHRLDSSIKSGGWDARYIGHGLEGKTVGLIGFGNIARQLCKYLSGFNCPILAYDIFFPEGARLPDNVTKADLDDIARKSDYVSLHLPAVKDTMGLIGKDFFDKMKPTAFLINTARGGVVVDDDMIEALKTRRIAGAALDVFEIEPLPENSELRKLNNCIYTPHIASYTYETVAKSAFQAIDNISDLFAGKTPRNILNPGYNKGGAAE